MPEWPSTSDASSVPGLLDSLGQGIVVFDRNWTYRFVNQAAADFLHTTSEALLGRGYYELYPEALGSPFERAYARVMETGVDEVVDDYYEPWQQYFRNRILPTVDGILILFDDVTDERRESLRRERNRALLKQVVDFAPVWITLCDRAGRLILVNRFAAGRLGRTSAQLILERPEDYLSGAMGDRVAEAHRAARHTGTQQEFDLDVEVSGRRPRFYHCIVFPTYAEDGVLTGTGSVASDITARVRAERGLREVNAQRHALLDRLTVAQEQERARIAADVHDDPVQALAAVDLRLGLLHRRLGAAAPDLLGLVEQVQDSVSGASDRLRELLFDLEPSDVQTPLVDGIRECAAHLLADVGITWELSVTPEGAPPDGVDLAHPERIKAVRIVKEALRNIRQHAHATAVRIRVAAEGGGVAVEIVDDGRGPGPASSPPGHRGITSMRDHAAVAGGWLVVEGDAAGGTAVRFWLPSAPEQDLTAS